MSSTEDTGGHSHKKPDDEAGTPGHPPKAPEKTKKTADKTVDKDAKHKRTSSYSLTSSETLGVDPGMGISGMGSTLSGSVTGVIGMITRITLDGVETSEIDTTTMNAVNRYRTFIANLKDARSVTLDMIYQKTNFAVLNSRVGQANESWTFAFPDGSTYVQLGYISRLGITAPFDDKMMTPVTLRMSGPPTFTAGAGT